MAPYLDLDKQLEYVKVWHRKRRADVLLGAPVAVHNASGYTLGCRCAICKAAKAEYRRKYRARTGRR